jgi:hypothetical protein
MEFSTCRPPSIFVKTESKIAAIAEADFMGIWPWQAYAVALCHGGSSYGNP